MEVSPGLRLKQLQKLALTPGLRQSISILQLSAVELEYCIQEEAAQNPVLTAEPPQSRDFGADLYQYAIDTVAQPISLGEHLQAQIRQMTAPVQVKSTALFLAGNLNENGYLAEPLQSMSAALKVSNSTALQALKLLQKCDPVGIGARDLRDCLGLQLSAMGLSADHAAAILDHLKMPDNLGSDRSRNAALLTKQQIADIPKIIANLDPKPAAAFQQSNAQPLIPDLIIQQDGAGLKVELIRSNAPSLHINTSFIKRVANQDPASSDYIFQQRNRALQLIRAIEARSKTLLRVARALVTHQHHFFTDGPSRLVPMTLGDLSLALNLHPSTVSRAMAGKSLSCAMGLFPLKYFLAGPVPLKNSTAVLSDVAVRQNILSLISAEPPQQPLTDATITRILQDNGVDIARRTVAKYRQCLKIPTSRSRRRSKATL